MARIAPGSQPSNGKPSSLARRARGLAFALLALAVSGCEAMERMDYLDRFFEPASRPGPVVAMEPIANRMDWPAADREYESIPVVAMEPRPNPVAPAPAPAAERTPQPNRTRAVEPNPAPASEADAASRTRQLVRQNQWLTQFWMELTPAQQQLVERRLQRGAVRLAAEPAQPAAVWDPMGLSDRAKLIFGDGQTPERPAPAPKRDDSISLTGR